MPTCKPFFFMNLLLENNYGVPSQNFVKKNVLCEKGDEITRFDGTIYGQWWAKLLRLLTVNSLSYFVKIKY